MKLCKICRRILPEEDFYPTPSGRRKVCRACYIARQTPRRRQQQWGGPGVGPRNPNGDPGTVRSKILSLPGGHPTRELYFKNRAEQSEIHKAMERWHYNGAQSVPFSETSG